MTGGKNITVFMGGNVQGSPDDTRASFLLPSFLFQIFCLRRRQNACGNADETPTKDVDAHRPFVTGR